MERARRHPCPSFVMQIRMSSLPGFKAQLFRDTMRPLMSLEVIPQAVRKRYYIEERGHASAILASDFRNEFQDIMDCLDKFVLKKSHILTPGGGRSPISVALDGFLYGCGWQEKSFDIKITI